MKFKQREVDGVEVFRISGTMWGGPEDVALVTAVDELARKNKLDLVLNLSGVKHLASNGIGILIRARARYLAHGGMIALCELNERGKSIIEVMRLQLLFEIYETEKEAIQAIRRSV